MGRKRTSKIAKNDVPKVVPPKCPKKATKMDNFSKAQLIQKCLELEAMLNELTKIQEESAQELNYLKKENEELKLGSEPQEKVSNFQVQTQTYPQNDVDFNCGVCVYQSSNEDYLWNHMDVEHDVKRQISNGTPLCEYCDQMFNIKSDLMFHIKSQHKDSLKLCKYFLKGICMFSDDTCWNSHEVNVNSMVTPHQKYICKYCGDVSKTKN